MCRCPRLLTSLRQCRCLVTGHTVVYHLLIRETIPALIPSYLLPQDNLKYLEAVLAFGVLTFIMLTCLLFMFMTNKAGYAKISADPKVKMLEMAGPKSDEMTDKSSI